MKKQIDAILLICGKKGIHFKALISPSRYYREDKQDEWTNFFLDDKGINTACLAGRLLLKCSL